MIIVTGASGFIGSCLVYALNKKGRTDIICVDRFEMDDKWLNLRGLKYQEYIQADEFLDSALLEDLFSEGVEAVYHMGACSDTTEKDMDYLMKNNVEYSQVLFKFCTDFDVPICYASSAATYGSGEEGYKDDESQIHKLRPLNAYGYSKQLFDEWVLQTEKKPPRWYGVKFFNVFGPNEYHKGKMSSVVYHAFNQIKESGKVKLFKSHHPDFGDGEQTRDFVYVKDVVDAMLQLMTSEHKGTSGIYNLGTGKARTFAELVTATFKALGLEPKIEYIDMPEHLRAQYQYYTQADMDKLTQALPNFSFKSLEDNVADYVQSHLNTDCQYLDLKRG